jgi:hypothetical protein
MAAPHRGPGRRSATSHGAANAAKPKENPMFNAGKLTRAAGVGTSLAMAVLVPLGATAGPAEAAVKSCTIRIVSVKALDLQEDGQGQDEVFLRLGDSRTTQRNYFEGQLRNTLGDGSDVFVNQENVRLVENDGPGNNDVLASRTIGCAAASVTRTVADASGDAIYRIRVLVVVNP